MNPHPSNTATSGAAFIHYDVKEIKILQGWASQPMRNLVTLLLFTTALFVRAADNSASGKSYKTRDIAPVITYEDTTHPLSDTSVFSIFGLGADSGAEILGVDKRSVTSKHSYPAWVRVRPGDHTFSIYFWDGHHNGVGPISVAGMKPRHVYEAQFKQMTTNTNLQVMVVTANDMGENPTYGVQVKKKYYPVRFDDQL
jgi:hypothetical protein